MDPPLDAAASPEITAAVIAGVVAVVTAVVTALITVALAERQVRQQYRLEFAAERVARSLMQDPDWRWRSFDIIKHHIGGFDDDELRRILVRAGAIRTHAANGVEVWGLIDRNLDMIGIETLDTVPYDPEPEKPRKRRARRTTGS